MSNADFLGITQKVGEENHVVARCSEHCVGGHIVDKTDFNSHISEFTVSVSPRRKNHLILASDTAQSLQSVTVSVDVDEDAYSSLLRFVQTLVERYVRYSIVNFLNLRQNVGCVDVDSTYLDGV